MDLFIWGKREMTKIAYSKSFKLLTFTVVCLLNGVAHAATETFPAIGAPSTVTLLVSGDNVALTGQGAEITLNIPAGFNLGASAGGDSVTSQAAPNIGNVTFLGNSIVQGRLGGGLNSQVLDVISGGPAGTAVTFNGPINTRVIAFTAPSTMTFNATAGQGGTIGALQFGGANGTAILGPNATFTGAATTTAANVGVGNITLNGGSQYNGAIGDATFYINQISLNGNAGIGGAIASKNIILGANTLSQVGAVTFPSGAQITVRALSDLVFGNISAPGSAINFTTGLQVNMLVDNSVVLSGVPLQVVTGTSGTFGPGSAPITVTSDNVRFTFTGLNPAGTGNVLIFPTVVPGILPTPVATPVATAFDQAGLIVAGTLPAVALTQPAAILNFGLPGDFLFVQQRVTALNNLFEIGNAQAQFAPIVDGADAIMSMEALNQFQGLWQSNLMKARTAKMCFKCDDPCRSLAPCSNSCKPCAALASGENVWNGEGLWIDGFGYTAHQSTRMFVPGYKANMYGAMMGIQHPISEHWQFGVSGGYASTHVNGKGIQINGSRIGTTEGTFYLGYNCDSWFFDHFFSYGWNRYKDFRNIIFPGFARVARANYHGQEYAYLFSGGHNFFFESGFTVTPLASLELQKLRMEGYTETGAISLNLIQRPQRYGVVQPGLGLMVGYPVYFGCATLYTEVHGKWLYDVFDYRIKNRSTFAGAANGPLFETRGVSPSPTQINAGASTTLYAVGNLSLKASYEMNYRHHFMSHAGKASIGYKF